MDLLGKEGEKAAEGIDTIAERLNKLQSHINAVDNAVQDLGGQVQRIEQNSVDRDELAQLLDQPDEDVNTSELKDFFVQLSKNQKRNERKLQDIEELESDLVDTLQSMQETVKKAHLRNNKLESRIKRLENKFSDVEMKVQKHDKKMEELEDIEEELEEVEEEQQREREEESFEKRQQNVEDELKDLRSSIKQFAGRVEE